MADDDFDAISIFEEEDEYYEESMVISVPDPVVIRGAGNITVLVHVCFVISLDTRNEIRDKAKKNINMINVFIVYEHIVGMFLWQN